MKWAIEFIVMGTFVLRIQQAKIDKKSIKLFL